jgi:phage baseplate assembly protein W
MNIDFPFGFGKNGRTSVAPAQKHINDMIEQVLFTNPGERVNQPDFGSGVMQMVFAPNSKALAAALHFTLQASLQRWLGDLIQLQALDVTAQDSTLSISIQYLLRATDQSIAVQFTRTV